MNILLFGTSAIKSQAKRETIRYANRVVADGGIIQNQLGLTAYYEILLRQFGYIPRDVFSSLGGFKLRNSGADNFISKWYNLNNDNAFDAVQATSGSQPEYDSFADTDLLVPTFDGTNDFLSIPDLGVFRARQFGSVYAIAKDTNPSAGDTSHVVLNANSATNTNRVSLATRSSSNSRIVTISRRNDAGAQVVNNGAIFTRDDVNSIGALMNWTSGGGVLSYQNNVFSTIGLFTGLDVTTSDTDSTAVNIGARNVSNERFQGIIPELILDTTYFTALQIKALHDFHKQFYPTLP